MQISRIHSGNHYVKSPRDRPAITGKLFSTASLCVSKKCIDFSHHIARISVFQYLILGIARALVNVTQEQLEFPGVLWQVQIKKNPTYTVRHMWGRPMIFDLVLKVINPHGGIEWLVLWRTVVASSEFLLAFPLVTLLVL